MLLFPLLGLTVSSLGFPSVFKVPGFTAILTTIGMTSPARPAEKKWKITPTTCDRN